MGVVKLVLLVNFDVVKYDWVVASTLLVLIPIGVLELITGLLLALTEFR